MPKTGDKPPQDHEESTIQKATTDPTGRAGTAISRNAELLARCRLIDLKPDIESNLLGVKPEAMVTVSERKFDLFRNLNKVSAVVGLVQKRPFSGNTRNLSADPVLSRGKRGTPDPVEVQPGPPSTPPGTSGRSQALLAGQDTKDGIGTCWTGGRTALRHRPKLGCRS